MKYLKKENNIYSFSANNEASIIVEEGEEFILEAYDCFANQLKDSDDKLSTINWDNINPATGPVYINGANAGDILRIKIKDINISDHSVMVVAPGEGLMGERFNEHQTKIYKIEENKLIFSEEIKIPISPMIGVIGTAPSSSSISTGEQGEHGGNMDCNIITKDSVLYLPVNVEGGLLALGDLHAVMGDGEVEFCGAEIAGEVNLKIDIIKNKKLPLPLLENADKIITISSANNLDLAVKNSCDKMLNFLINFSKLSSVDAALLMSAVGDARICQAVDPLKTARFEMEKKYLKIKQIMEVVKNER